MYLRSKSSPDPDLDRRILRKCDLQVIPISYILYMLSSLDHTNLGNVRIYGLEKDLGIKGNDYNIAVQIFIIAYILLEVPSNLIFRRVRPST